MTRRLGALLLPRTPAGQEEYRRLLALGVTDSAALVLAAGLEADPTRRGDDLRAYWRARQHRWHASPAARSAWAAYERGRLAR